MYLRGGSGIDRGGINLTVPQDIDSAQGQRMGMALRSGARGAGSVSEDEGRCIIRVACKVARNRIHP